MRGKVERIQEIYIAPNIRNDHLFRCDDCEAITNPVGYFDNSRESMTAEFRSLQFEKR